jgi:hypothetical protein
MISDAGYTKKLNKSQNVVEVGSAKVVAQFIIWVVLYFG